jgi:hypothetical protein
VPCLCPQDEEMTVCLECGVRALASAGEQRAPAPHSYHDTCVRAKLRLAQGTEVIACHDCMGRRQRRTPRPPARPALVGAPQQSSASTGGQQTGLPCKRCTVPVKAGKRFCAKCGMDQEREVLRACTVCGAPGLQPDDAFCADCGSPQPCPVSVENVSLLDRSQPAGELPASSHQSPARQVGVGRRSSHVMGALCVHRPKPVCVCVCMSVSWGISAALTNNICGG